MISSTSIALCATALSLDQVVNLPRYLTSDSYHTKLDDKSGFDHFLLSEDSLPYMGAEWGGWWLVWKTLPQGWRESPYVYQTLGQVIWFYQLIGHRKENRKLTFRALALCRSEFRIRFDEGLTLETSAFKSLLRWPIYIINSVDKTNYYLVILPPTQHHSFLRNLPPLLGQVATHTLRNYGIPCSQYIDDRHLGESWGTQIKRNSSFDAASCGFFVAGTFQAQLGYFLHLAKCVPIPKQQLIFLGHLVDTMRQRSLSQKKKSTSSSPCGKKSCPSNRFPSTRFQGKCVSLTIMVPTAQLYTRAVAHAIPRPQRLGTPIKFEGDLA